MHAFGRHQKKWRKNLQRIREGKSISMPGGESYDRILDSRSGCSRIGNMGFNPSVEIGRKENKQGREAERLSFPQKQPREHAGQVRKPAMLFLPQARCQAELLCR
jgi:hypothetical protein